MGLGLLLSSYGYLCCDFLVRAALSRFRHVRFGHSYEFLDTPSVIAQSGFHRWRDPQRHMTPAEIVVHKIESNRVAVIVEFFTEPVCQPREASHGHSHC
jgi:hypothetical protein